jgi:hypothetical protein
VVDSLLHSVVKVHVGRLGSEFHPKLKGRIATGFCAVVQFLLRREYVYCPKPWLAYVYIYIGLICIKWLYQLLVCHWGQHTCVYLEEVIVGVYKLLVNKQPVAAASYM